MGNMNCILINAVFITAIFTAKQIKNPLIRLNKQEINVTKFTPVLP
jgi:hypothetical protein